MAARLAALAFVTAIVVTGCSAPATVDEGGAAGEPLVAFYGDSYTLGTGASDPAHRWSTIICRDRGWVEFNPSVNGLGFVNNRFATDLPALIVEQDPDIVVVTMGLNDNFSYDVAGESIRDRIATDFDFLSMRLPGARVVVVEPFWYTDARPVSVDVIIDWVREGAEGIDADWIGGASRWLEGHPEWMAADGLHPNDDGYAELARRMDAELALIGL